jgi:endonuclease/exonuclease/phosphatase family metal-dependent hydrolase
LALVSLQVLTWNLMHGRSVPPAGRGLLAEFAESLERWEWDVALLQEVPPWWPALLGSRLGAPWALVLTSRNLGLPLRRAVAVRAPDLIKSNGGGCNAVLVRGLRIEERRTLRLAVLPERRWLLAVRLGDGPGRGAWVGNLHLSGRPRRAPAGEARRASAAMLGFAAGSPDPIVLGGDFNLPSLTIAGFEPAGGLYVDHVFARGLHAAGEPVIPDRGVLSDHAPVLVTLE